MIISCWEHIQRNLLQVVQYSSRGPFHVGKYNQCIQADSMDYYLILLAQKGEVKPSAGAGLCLPDICSAEFVQNGFNYILGKLAFPLYVLEVSNKTDQYSYPFTPLFFLTTFLLISLTILVILSTLSSTFRTHPILKYFNIFQSFKRFNYCHRHRNRHNKENNEFTIEEHRNHNLQILHGVKSLSAMWTLMYGSEYVLVIYFISNAFTVEQFQLSTWKALVMEGAVLPADAFLFVGGFLAAYSVLRKDISSWKEYGMTVVNRIVRFLPSYYMAILIFYCLLMHMVWGPYAKVNEKLVHGCDSMWGSLLFIDNLLDHNMCMPWGWYIQVDLQLFIFSLFLFYLYKSHSKFLVLILIYLSMTLSFAYTFQQVYDHGYKNITHLSDLNGTAGYLHDIYYTPWGRCAAYLYGVLLGIAYHQFCEDGQDGNGLFAKLKRVFQGRQWIRRGFELLGVAIGLFVIFVPRSSQGVDNSWSNLAQAFYLTYSKTLFVIGLSIVILPSLLVQNHTPFVRSMLDTKFFHFVSQISLWVYLIHLIFVFQYFFTRNNDLYFQIWSAYPIFATHTVCSIVIGFLLSLICDFPFKGIQEKYLKSNNRIKMRRRINLVQQQQNHEASQKLMHPLQEEDHQ